MRCEILVFPGVEELDVFGPYEVMRAAGIRTTLVCLADPLPVTFANGAIVAPHGCASMPELFIVPGGGWASHAAEGVRAQTARPDVLEFLREVHHRGGVLAGVCTGTMLLAHAGLLAGRHAITHRSAIDALRAFDVKVVEQRVVDDGDIVTCGGVTAGLDLALWLVERFLGTEAADRTAGYLEYGHRSGVWMRPL